MSKNNDGWVLRAERATKHYGTTAALVEVDFTVDSAESVAIMGPSGSGKSTLLHLLAGIEVPDSGRVLLRHRFGFVFQQGHLIPELTATENVALPLLLTGSNRRDASERAETVLAQLGIDGLGERRIGQLSGGQAQRVAIARALIMNSQVLFADEPTGALDSHTAQVVLSQLLEINREANRAVVIVTHDDQVAAHCSRIVRLLDGRIDSVEQETHL